MLPVYRRVQLSAEQVLERNDLHLGETKSVLDGRAHTSAFGRMDRSSGNG